LGLFWGWGYAFSLLSSRVCISMPGLHARGALVGRWASVSSGTITLGRSLLVVVLGNMCYLPVPSLRVACLGRGLGRAGLLVVCTTPPCEAVCILVLPHFPVSRGTCLQKQRSWGYRSLRGSVLWFNCLGFFGLEMFLGGWRKAVSRMAAPRGPAFGHH